LLGGALALWSFEVMVMVQSAAAWMCLILALLIIEPPYKNSRRKLTASRSEQYYATYSRAIRC